MTATCIECNEPISPLASAHDVHSDVDCTADACRCDISYAHARCCRACTPLATRLAAAHARQVALGEFPVQRVPMASTKGLPKMRTS